ncbi:MAG: hypothetical protein IPG68_08885 [Micrococcales bacterium]|nr:hypothetical protein [Micrococcales bacterium]
MPNGHATIASDQANEQLASALRDSLGATAAAAAPADLCIGSGPPVLTATHIVIVGDLDEQTDAWDRDVAAQSVAGVLWVPPGQEPVDVVRGWWLLRHDTPTTPLSDLLDDNGRALRWSVLAVARVGLSGAQEVEVDDAQIRAGLDDSEIVQRLGRAIDRLGGGDAESVLGSVESFRSATADLDGLADLPPAGATPDLDAAVAEHLRQVQRSGFGRWRGAKARAASQAGLVAAAKDVAAQRLREVIAARTASQRAEQEVVAGEQAVARTVAAVQAALGGLSLPVTPDFGRVPRPWTNRAPEPRRYVLAHEQHLACLAGIESATVRDTSLPDDEVLCLLIQSGFSLPALWHAESS